MTIALVALAILIALTIAVTPVFIAAQQSSRDISFLRMEAAILFSIRLTADDARLFLLDWLERDDADIDARWPRWPAFRADHVARGMEG